MYIVWQHRIMEMMKRAGRGHSDSGVGGTAQWELVLGCRACPQPGKNMADGWEKVDWSKMPEDRLCVKVALLVFIADDPALAVQV
jgi:hypothetical protein